MKPVAFPQLSLPPPKYAFIPPPTFPSRRRSYPLIKFSRRMAATETGESAAPSSPAAIRLQPIEATPESFREFGQVIEASPDGDEFGPLDAQLDLSRGIPRFYIMHLEDRPLRFSTITHHASVTQCLGSIGGHVWYLGVARPSLVDQGETGAENAVKSKCGHSYVPPAVDGVCVFKVSGPKFLKLDRGTWHAGPLFLEKTMDFYNLELSNTNVVDHTTHNFVKKNNAVFVFDE
ncbi:hypothetical protein SASPL_136947 [Salvia splendens]|uniref:Ureidoglycolate hydrolase n=1 Tax=Salvia splendens TaxID=180675 RepID=A0A8X8X272_SALSN|nr:uncharacterized protein LOC121762700 [Salvia splendens]KAG6404694.1 hypothetical protein SASPL_136947 [Salvia splendens]